jgi:hypothetical protein
VTDDSALRVSDADREHTALALRDAAADGRLTLDELTERLDGAYAARTRGELDSVVADLGRAVPQPPARAGGRRWVVSLMGGSTLRGRFRIERELRVVSVMGGSHIDLRSAELAQPEVTMTVLAFMGGINVIVPEGVEVDAHGLIPFMGGRNVRVPTPAGELAPRIRLRGLAFMGGVNVIARPHRSA